MTEEKKCYIHNTPTRLSCTSCGKPICPKCMINSAVGYKCKDCVERTLSHVEKITPAQYMLGLISGLAVGSVLGYIWSFLARYGLFVNLLTAYALGFCISRTISKVIGNKIGLKIQIMAALIVIISMVFNPVNLGIMGVTTGISMVPAVIYSVFVLSCPLKFIAILIAIWAAVRHFKF